MKVGAVAGVAAGAVTTFAGVVLGVVASTGFGASAGFAPKVNVGAAAGVALVAVTTLAGVVLGTVGFAPPKVKLGAAFGSSAAFTSVFFSNEKVGIPDFFVSSDFSVAFSTFGGSGVGGGVGVFGFGISKKPGGTFAFLFISPWFQGSARPSFVIFANFIIQLWPNN